MTAEVKVRATQPGHYKRLRKAGETFSIPEKLFSSTWMEKVDAPKAKPGPKAKEQKVDESKAKPKEE